MVPATTHMGSWRSLAIWKEADLLRLPANILPMSMQLSQGALPGLLAAGRPWKIEGMGLLLTRNGALLALAHEIPQPDCQRL